MLKIIFLTLKWTRFQIRRIIQIALLNLCAWRNVFVYIDWWFSRLSVTPSIKTLHKRKKNLFIVIGLPNLGPSRFKLRFPSWPLQHHIKIDCPYTWCYVRKIGSRLIWRLPAIHVLPGAFDTSFLCIYLMLFSTWRWRWLHFSCISY